MQLQVTAADGLNHTNRGGSFPKGLCKVPGVGDRLAPLASPPGLLHHLTGSLIFALRFVPAAYVMEA